MRPRRHRRPAGSLLAAWLIAAAFVVGPGVASAQTQDYDVDSTRWNGLSRFVDLSESVGTPVEPSTTLNYTTLDPSETLVVVYPTAKLNVEALAEFVIDGGRILLADDFGRAEGFLNRLDIRRRRAGEKGLPHDDFVRGNPALPIFEPTGVHPLIEGVGVVVANHPTVLEHSGGPVVEYSDGGGVIYDMNLGEGKVVVFGDASLLINHMLRVADNRRLAANALRYVCQPREDCRPQLLAGDFRQEGAYGGGNDAERSVAWVAREFNELVAELQREVPSRPLLFYLALILAGGLAIYLGTVFSLNDSRRYSEYIEEAVQEVPAPQSEFEWNVSRFGADRRETNFALPLAILKELVQEILAEEFGPWDEADESPSPEALARRIRQQRLGDLPETEKDRIERKARELLASLQDIPTRHRVFLDSDAYFSDGDLIQVYRQAMELLELIGLQEEYERRTRTLV